VSETYADGGQQPLAEGGLLIGIISVLAAVLVIAGLLYATGTGGRHQAALAAAGCEPNLAPSGLQCTTASMLAGEYVKITAPAIQELATDAAAYSASDGHSLAVATAALMAEVTVENAVGTNLAQFPFPPAVAPAARTLIHADRALAALTQAQARSPALTRLRSFNQRVLAASIRVHAEMDGLGRALRIPPTASQEP
jgi:hypothetical protein